MKMNGTVGYAQLDRGQKLPPLYADPSVIELPPMYGTQTTSSSRTTSDSQDSSSQDNSPDKTPTTDTVQPVS